MAGLRFLVFIYLPLAMAKYITAMSSYLEFGFISYGGIVFVLGIMYIIFKFADEAFEDPRIKLVSSPAALIFLFSWTYYLLNGGYLKIGINGSLISMANWVYFFLTKGLFMGFNPSMLGELPQNTVQRIVVDVDYHQLLIILLVLVALRIPEVIMRYYLELQRYDRMKREQSSAGESL